MRYPLNPRKAGEPDLEGYPVMKNDSRDVKGLVSVKVIVVPV